MYFQTRDGHLSINVQRRPCLKVCLFLRKIPGWLAVRLSNNPGCSLFSPCMSFQFWVRIEVSGQFGFSVAKSILQESGLCIPPPGIFRGYPREATCYMTVHARPTSLRERYLGGRADCQADRTEYELINYFYRNKFPSRNFNSVTIQIIHMTIWIIQESDREGRAVCQIWLQGGLHNDTSKTDKKNWFGQEPLEDLPPPLKRKECGG